MGEVNLSKNNNMFYRYEVASKILGHKIDLIVSELVNSMGDTPVEHVKGRIKSFDSIVEKLKGDGFEFNASNMKKCLNDVVGIRIVCCFRNDLARIIRLINNDPDIKVINTKNFIDNPKDNGYFSYHMIVEVPVVNHDTNVVDYVRAEIQIRTLAMDLWASLQHKISYKKNVNLSLDSREKIDVSSKVTCRIDRELEDIIRNLDNSVDIARIDDDFYDASDIINDRAMYKYKIAQKKLMVEIDSMYESFKLREEDNPIEHIKTRLKTPESICRKLSLMKCRVSEENISNCLNDVVGVRIVCSFMSDLDEVIKTIYSNPEIEVIDVKDYISNPKKNGYSSYHIIVRVPVYVDGNLEYVNAEIQVRTKAMNMWASLEHKLCYKKQVSDEIKVLLKEYSEKISELDSWFNEIINEVKHDNYVSNSNVKVKKLVKNN